MDLEDRFAILDLIADYAFAWDAQEPERWAGLFTPDGVWECYVPGVRPPVRRLTNLGERVTASREAFVEQVSSWTRMYQSDIRFRNLTRDTASLSCSIFLLQLDLDEGGAIRPLYTATTSDRFRKTPVGWRFAKRELHSDQNPGFGNAQYFDSGADAASD